jgi:hypothetical protein
VGRGNTTFTGPIGVMKLGPTITCKSWPVLMWALLGAAQSQSSTMRGCDQDRPRWSVHHSALVECSLQQAVRIIMLGESKWACLQF